VPAILAIHLLWTGLGPARRRAAVLVVVDAAVSTLVWSARNTICLGALVGTSPADSALVAPELDPNMIMASPLGRDEIENYALTRQLSRPRVEQLVADRAERRALLADKLFWFVPGLPGDSQAVNPRWVSPYISDVARDVAIVGLIVLMVAVLALPTPARAR